MATKPRTTALATTLVRKGMRGAETRHIAMVERLRELGFVVRAETCDIRPEAMVGKQPLSLRKFVAGWRTSRSPKQRGEAFFAFDPYCFIGGGLAARLKGNKSVFFCRNDQIYQAKEIARITGDRIRVPRKLFILQYLCLLLATTYVVQSPFAARHLRKRFRNWPLVNLDHRIAVLNNDIRLEVQQPKVLIESAELRVAFVANPAWEKKGFFILERLLTSKTFRESKVRFSIVGTGDAFDRLKAAADPSRERSVDFLGFVSDISTLRESADVVFIPSVVDHFPNVVIECAALGVPMVLSDIEAHRNIFPEHLGYFQLNAKPSEIMDKLEKVAHGKIRETVTLDQQRDIARLEHSWCAPLAKIFEFEDEGA